MTSIRPTEVLPPLEDTAPRDAGVGLLPTQAVPLVSSSHPATVALPELTAPPPPSQPPYAVAPVAVVAPVPTGGEEAQALAALEPGSTFHGLKIHSRLGEGGMGAAYLASHPVLRMPLVIKTFKRSASGKIFHEAVLAGRVSSQHVVSVIDAGTQDGVPFIVQRYVDGIDLEELLHKQRTIGRRLPVNAVCRVIVDAAHGLHAIHQAGVVHRDVKPANLFLSGHGVAAIGDFGIAVERSFRGVSEPIVGTPHFMAPEQWTQAAVDRRTDLYALGATAHFLATNEPVFAGDSALQLGLAHATTRYAPPPARDPREAYLFATIERMLRKRPEDRFTSADHLARTLSVITEPMPVLRPHAPTEATVGDLGVRLVQGNLAEQEADVLVSAANSILVMDAGVARALVRAGGPAIEDEAVSQGPAAMGDVVWTAAGTLKARWVAHAVAALEGAICIQRCALRVLLGAESRRCHTVAFSAIGTGVGEVPMALGAKLVLEAVRTFASFEPEHVRNVRVVLYDQGAVDTWADVLASM